MNEITKHSAESDFPHAPADWTTAKATEKAAELNITQAGASQHVAALEKDLGTRLFERDQHPIALTASGRLLYTYARRILDLVEQLDW